MTNPNQNLIERLQTQEKEVLQRDKLQKIWEPESPGEAIKLQEVERLLGATFPETYRQLLLYSDGGGLYGELSRLLFFKISDLPKFNPDPVWSQYLADMIIFGDDEGDYIYYFDPENRLGRGAWAVYAVEKGALSFDYSIYIANDISQLVERILNGDDILEGSYLK